MPNTVYPIDAHTRFSLIETQYPAAMAFTEPPTGYKGRQSFNHVPETSGMHLSSTREPPPAQQAYFHVAKVTQAQQPNHVWAGIKRGLLDGVPFVSTEAPEGSAAYISREREWHGIGQTLSVPVSFIAGGLLGILGKVGYTGYRSHKAAALTNEVNLAKQDLANLAARKVDNSTKINNLMAATNNPKLSLYYLQQAQIFRNANTRIDQRRTDTAARLTQLQDKLNKY